MDSNREMMPNNCFNLTYALRATQVKQMLDGRFALKGKKLIKKILKRLQQVFFQKNEHRKQEERNIISEEYKFDKTKNLIHRDIDLKIPLQELQNILESVIELLNYPKNDFAWSSWENHIDSVKEVQEIINTIKLGKKPDRDDVSILFLPTGPLQEASISSGWGDGFLKVAEKFDAVERILWKE